jgi:hypothetical protein
MEFIIENYPWFIAGGVILIMTIIGFIAEKTNFGQNLKKEKKVKEKPIKKEEQKEIVKEEIKEETPVMDFPAPILEKKKEENVVEDVSLVDNVEPVIETIPLTDDIQPFVEETAPLEEIKEVPLEEIKEEIVEPIVDVKESDFEEAIEPVIIEEKPELPDIEEVVEEEVTDESSLWKF